MNDNMNVRPLCQYTHTHKKYAAVALIISFFLIKTYIKSTTGLGLMATVMSLTVSIFNFMFCKSSGMKGNKTTLFIFITNIILSFSFLVSDNSNVLLVALFIFLGNVYFSYASYREGNRCVITNLFRAVFISPLYEFGSLFGALFSKGDFDKKRKQADIKKIIPTILGVLLSIPVCVVVAVLLGSADESFENIFKFIDYLFWNDLSERVTENLFVFLFAIPVAMYIFSAVYSRSYKMIHENELEKLPPTKTRILPITMCIGFLIPLTFMYVMFVYLQVVHVFRPLDLDNADFTYSQYARDGFFQLCIVVIINLAVISVIMLFSKEKRLPKILRIFVIVFSVLTLCLIVTALSKMLLYIKVYGITPKRMYTSIFMVYLFIMFAVLIVKQIITQISFTKIGYCVMAVVLAMIVFVPVDRLIAEYNIGQWEENNISWMGISAMYELDSSAVPVFAKVEGNSDVEKFFDNYSFRDFCRDNMTFWDFNIQRNIAASFFDKGTPSP